MQVRASAKFVRTSPRKVRLVMQGLRGMPVEAARLQLRFTPRPIARAVAKVLDYSAGAGLDVFAFVAFGFQEGREELGGGLFVAWRI